MTTATIDEKRLARVAKMQLKHGSHKSLKAGACVMEAVAYVAGETWSDTPACTCPVIGTFMRSWNDGLHSDEDRTRLLGPLVPQLVHTRSTRDVELRRSYMALDWLVRVNTAAWLDLAGLTVEAAALRALPEITDTASVASGKVALRAARDAARAAAGDAAGESAWAAALVAARDAARDAAWTAVGDAALIAAWYAARDAVEYAARSAAGDAAGAATWTAAGVVAAAGVGDAAWVAAWRAGAAALDGAKAAISPTVALLQTSAVELVKRMCAVQS